MRRLLIALLALPATAVVWATPAQALSCVGPDDVLREAAVVYAGHVVDSDARRLLVEVDEVWKGGPVEDHQWLTVELIGWSSWSDGHDDHLREHISDPTPIVFAPEKGAVNPCTSWALDTPGVRKHRPRHPTEPVATPATPGTIDDDLPADSSVPLLAYAGGGVLLLALAGGAWWRLRPSRRR